MTQAILEQSMFLRSRPWRTDAPTLPEKLQNLPSMVSDEERQMLVYIASKFATNSGSVVELGALFGGSTAALAHGASLATTDYKMLVYDLFEPARWHVEKYILANGYPDPGVDTLPMVKGFLSDYRVTYKKGDILQERWTGGPIDVLHVDAAKSRTLAVHIIEQFFTALQPGSVVIMQDYMSQRHPWCIHMMELMDHHFEYAGCTTINAALFVCKTPVRKDSAEELKTATDIDYLYSIKKAARHFDEAPQINNLAKHIIMVKDNPNAQNISEYKKTTIAPERVQRVVGKYLSKGR